MKACFRLKKKLRSWKRLKGVSQSCAELLSCLFTLNEYTLQSKSKKLFEKVEDITRYHYIMLAHEVKCYTFNSNIFTFRYLNVLLLENCILSLLYVTAVMRKKIMLIWWHLRFIALFFDLTWSTFIVCPIYSWPMIPNPL